LAEQLLHLQYRRLHAEDNFWTNTQVAVLHVTYLLQGCCSENVCCLLLLLLVVVSLFVYVLPG
jgi:hypothetical protein